LTTHGLKSKLNNALIDNKSSILTTHGLYSNLNNAYNIKSGYLYMSVIWGIYDF